MNGKGLDAFSSICTEMFYKHAPKKSDIYDLTISLSLIRKFLGQSWREIGQEIIFYKTEVKKIENYFANKEISAIHFCENLKWIISQI